MLYANQLIGMMRKRAAYAYHSWPGLVILVLICLLLQALTLSTPLSSSADTRMDVLPLTLSAEHYGNVLHVPVQYSTVPNNNNTFNRCARVSRSSEGEIRFTNIVRTRAAGELNAFETDFVATVVKMMNNMRDTMARVDIVNAFLVGTRLMLLLTCTHRSAPSLCPTQTSPDTIVAMPITHPRLYSTTSTTQLRDNSRTVTR